MQRHMVVVLSEPLEGREAEFNDWYEHTHLDEVLATTGWLSGQRFELSDEIGTKCPLPYLALYEVTADDPKQAIKQLNATRSQRQQSDTFKRKTAALWVFSETGEKHQNSDD